MLFFIKFIFCDIHTELEVLGSHEVLQFGERFFTEVAELQEVALVERHQVAQRVDFGGLEAVECADREVEVDELGLQELADMGRRLVELFLHGFGLDIECNALVGEEQEVLDEDSLMLHTIYVHR